MKSPNRDVGCVGVTALVEHREVRVGERSSPLRFPRSRDASYRAISGFVEIAPAVWRLSLIPLDLLNVVRAGRRACGQLLPWNSRRLTRARDGRSLSAHVLTHGHPDHQGRATPPVRRRGLPLWCAAGGPGCGGVRRAHVAPAGTNNAARPHGQPLGWPAPSGSPRRDCVSDFVVTEPPGHTQGTLSYWRESDRVLIGGARAIARLLRAWVAAPGRRPVRVFVSSLRGWPCALSARATRLVRDPFQPDAAISIASPVIAPLTGDDDRADHRIRRRSARTSSAPVAAATAPKEMNSAIRRSTKLWPSSMVPTT